MNNAEIKFNVSYTYISKMLKKNNGTLSNKNIELLKKNLNSIPSPSRFNQSNVNFFIANMNKVDFVDDDVKNFKIIYDEYLKYNNVDVTKYCHCMAKYAADGFYSLVCKNKNDTYNIFNDYILDLKTVIRSITQINVSKTRQVIVTQVNQQQPLKVMNNSEFKIMVVFYKNCKNKNRVILVGQGISPAGGAPSPANLLPRAVGPAGATRAAGPADVTGAPGPAGIQGATMLAYAQGPSPIVETASIEMEIKETAGAVNRVLPHPINPDIMYIGAVNGGIWKTLNAQAESPKWFPLTDKLKCTSIGALAFDTADPTINTIIAGIGRTSSFFYKGGPLTGLQISTNAGDSFTEVDGNGRLKGLNINGVVKHGNTILVSVNTADKLIAENVGVFQSKDNGLTFSQISVGDGKATGMPAGKSSSIVQDPDNPKTLYASIYNTSNSIFKFNNNSVIEEEKNGIYKSTDTGSTWKRVGDNALQKAIGVNAINIKLATGPSGTIFVAIVSSVSSEFDRLTAVFRYNGNTWQAMDLPTTTEKKNDESGDIIVGIHPGGQGTVHFSLVADPSDPNIVYIGGDRQPSQFGSSNKKGMPSRYVKNDNNDKNKINILTDEEEVNFPNSIGATTWSGRLFRGDASKKKIVSGFI